MLQQQAMRGSQKFVQLALWKRMILVTAMLLPGGSLAMLVPSQSVYAHSTKPSMHHHTGHKGSSTRTENIKLLIVCKTGNGGKGGSATRKSDGANGGSGGNCIINVPIKVFLTIQHNARHK
jgi:hypothetical protein